MLREPALKVDSGGGEGDLLRMMKRRGKGRKERMMEREREREGTHTYTHQRRKKETKKASSASPELQVQLMCHPTSAPHEEGHFVPSLTLPAISTHTLYCMNQFS